ncbi:hypothetical protein OGAPHI_002627 [Ogataea philodendri]|uniref:Kinesin motor domain-containing protein n=2 Tax=Saccharomycotina TaxID=147537 RepID=A0A9P8PBM8_9ASCO|nr:uncharacterized protein OGAPHI_002627 [Ogataea philodendri]KAH3668872.1 hypothetical protein OGAPHI_002627 [Ogataea philodendri]
MLKVNKRRALSPVKANTVPKQASKISQVQEDQSIKVVVRVRPLLERELEGSPKCLVEVDKEQLITLTPDQSSAQARKYRDAQNFKFSKCLWSYDRRASTPFADQDTVFTEVGLDMLDNTINGFNSCVMAYGQTGSGKTFTMMGSKNERGLIPLVCESLFTKLKQQIDTKFEVKVSFIEIYQENVVDLLGTGEKLRVRENSNRVPFVENLSEYTVGSSQEIMELLAKGFDKRTTAETHLNKQSSRSHSILTVTVVQEQFDPDTNSFVKLKSNLKLVDLAGSEKFVASDGLEKIRQQEGSKINKSLVTLGRILTLLAESPKQRTVIPYRESILTWLLKDSIGGNSKTTMIACISPTDFDETLSTLRFATITSKIENKVKVNKELQFDMDQMVGQFELEKKKLLQCITDLKESSTEKDEVKKLENYVNWQNNYIDTLAFTNKVTLKKLDANLKASQERNRLLMSSLISAVKPAEPEDYEFDEFEEIIKQAQYLDIETPLENLKNDLHSDLVKKYTLELVENAI